MSFEDCCEFNFWFASETVGFNNSFSLVALRACWEFSVQVGEPFDSGQSEILTIIIAN